MNPRSGLPVGPDPLDVDESEVDWGVPRWGPKRPDETPDSRPVRAAHAPVHEIRVHVIICADDGGVNAHPITDPEVESLVAQVNDLFAPAGIHFNFDKTRDIERVSRTKLNRNKTWNEADLHKPAEPPLDDLPNWIERCNEGMRADHVGQITLLFGLGTSVKYNAAKGEWEINTKPAGGGGSSGGNYTVNLHRYEHGLTAVFVAHEIGHFFHLGHTHNRGARTRDEAAELIRNAVENGTVPPEKGELVFDGDWFSVSDTPPDPGNIFWKEVTGGACSDVAAVDVDVEFTKPIHFPDGDKTRYTYELAPNRGNMMSYFGGCPVEHAFSEQQISLMRAAIEHGNRQRLVSADPRIWEAPPVGALSLKPGTVDVVVPAGDCCFYHASWKVVDGFPNNYWTALGTAPGNYVTDSPALASWTGDRLDVVARSVDGSVLHKALKSPDVWRPSQIGWNRLGGSILHSPAAVSWGPGRLDIVAHGKDDQVLHKCWNESAGAWSPEGTSWRVLGGQISDSPTVVSWGKGRLDIFVQGKNHGVWHKSWDDARGHWTPEGDGWHLLGQKIVGAPAAVSWGSERLDVFVHGTGDQVWYKFWDASRGRWCPGGDEWTPLGGLILGSPSVASWGRGRLDLVVTGQNHGVWHKSWDATREEWSPAGSGWRSLGGDVVGSPKIVATGPGKFYVFARDKYGRLLHKRWDASTAKWYPSQSEWDYYRNAACY